MKSHKCAGGIAAAPPPYGDLSFRDVSNVTNISHTFSPHQRFNGHLSGWDVSKVTNMHSTLARTTSFDQKLSGTLSTSTDGKIARATKQQLAEGGEPYLGLSRDSVRQTTDTLPTHYRHTTDTLPTHYRHTTEVGPR